MGVSGTVSFAFNVNDARTVGVNSADELRAARVNKGFEFTDGAGALQGNQLWHDKRTFSGTTDDIDLAGVLADLFGTTVALARVKAIYVENLSASNTISVGAAASNPVTTILNSTGTLTIRPGGSFMIAAPDATGHAITAGSADILRVSGTSGQQYKIAVLGATS